MTTCLGLAIESNEMGSCWLCYAKEEGGKCFGGVLEGKMVPRQGLAS